MKKTSIVIILLFVLLYVLPLGVRPMVVPDEVRYAEISREMITSGDWIVPRLNGVRYFEKPILGYWLNSVSMVIFGENAFAIRFPSAMAVGISALMIFLLVRRFSGRRSGEQTSGIFTDHSAGILAAAMFLTCFEVFAVGVFSVLDSMLSMFITGAMVSFFLAHMENNPRKKTGFLALFGAFCGLAFLTKGFLAFAVPVIAILPFMLWERQWKELFRIVWVPIIAAVLISLPWCVMIHLKEGDFWHYFFWIEHIKRFTANDAQHSEPFWFYVPMIAGGALPWTILLPAAFSGMKNTRSDHRLIRFAICWFLFPFLFFSVSKGKLGTYILPCFPPFVILMTLGVLNYFERGKKKAFTISVSAFAGVTGILALALIVNQMTGFPGVRAYGSGETWKWILGTAGLLTWTGLMIFAVRKTAFQNKLTVYCAAPVILIFISHFIIPQVTAVRKAPGEFLLRHSDKIRSDTIIVSYDDPVRAVCWFYKRDNVYLLMGGGEPEYGLSYDDSKHRLLNAGQFGKLVDENSGKNRVVLISKAKDYKRFRHLIPKSVSEDNNRGFVFVRF